MKQLKQCSPLRVQPSNTTTSLEKSSLSYAAVAAVIDGESSDHVVVFQNHTVPCPQALVHSLTKMYLVRNRGVPVRHPEVCSVRV